MVDHKRFAKKLCELCYAGDVQAMRLLLSYTDGLPIARAELQGPEGIQITVTYVQQNNRIDLTGAAPSTDENHPGVQAPQCRVLRAPLGQDKAGDGSPDSRGPEG
jgi:hypothetical protein